jgi:hypothetical protein
MRSEEEIRKESQEWTEWWEKQSDDYKQQYRLWWLGYSFAMKWVL